MPAVALAKAGQLTHIVRVTVSILLNYLSESNLNKGSLI